MKEFYRLIGDIVIYLAPIISILYFIGFIKFNRAYKVFTFYLFFISLVQIGAYYVGRGYWCEPNLYYSHYYFIAQFILLSVFYNELLELKWIKYVLGAGLIFIAYQFIDDPSIYYRYNSIGMFFTQMIIVIYSIIYFYKSLTVSRGFIIVNIGIFMYLLSSALIFVSGNIVLSLDFSLETKRILINVNRFLSITFQTLIFIEWWRNYRPKKIV